MANGRRGGLWEVLVFDRMITGPVIHWVYWLGMAVIVVAAFSVIGASAGIAFKEGTIWAFLLVLPVLVVGLMVVAALGLLWRAMCEFYVVVFRIGDDLAAMRRAWEDEQQRGGSPQR